MSSGRNLHGPRPQHKHVWASLPRQSEGGMVAPADIVYPWLLNEVTGPNRGLAKEMVFVQDGQESLWEACDRHLPRKNRTHILDLLHVTPRLWKAAHAFYQEGDEENVPSKEVAAEVSQVLADVSDELLLR